MKGKYIKTKEGQQVKKGLEVYLKRYDMANVELETLKDMYALQEAVLFQLMNDSQHPSFKRGLERIIAYDPDFKLYPDGINDSHIETFLKNFFKEE